MCILILHHADGSVSVTVLTGYPEAECADIAYTIEKTCAHVEHICHHRVHWNGGE